MEGTIRDYLGREIKLGDRVVFPVKGTRYHILGKGTVIGWAYRKDPSLCRVKVLVDAEANRSGYERLINCKLVCIFERGK